MTHSSRIALVVHGHFYQPPRENPWTDEVASEPSALPFHDWNERINAESYRANAFARRFSAGSRVQAMLNNYDHISFNFGPTLARWIERKDPATYRHIRQGDVRQVQRLGFGGAMAQVWAHPIAPLLSPSDRRTQILWGLADFQRQFGRPSEGMWLPETAVSPATLEDLIDLGIKFTVLGPEQIAAVRAPGGAFTPVNRDTLDTGRTYKWPHSDGSGRFITLALFDGPLSRDLAFGVTTRDAATYLASVKTAAARSNATGKRLVLAASDGELYGHHKKFADLTLAYLTSVEAPAHGVDVTNLAAFIAQEPATWEAELARGPNGEGTAWSCQHGLGRWRRHCGCVTNADASPSQAWRGPLRAAMDGLRDDTADLFEDQGAGLFEDPWGARDAYGEISDAAPEKRQDFLRDFGRSALSGGNNTALTRAHRLMELQRATLLMYASCGWFFDDVAGLESTLIIRQAAHALDLWRQLGATPPTQKFQDTLAQARSNVVHLGTGADVFRRVCRDRVTPARAAAESIFRAMTLSAFPDTPEAVPGYRVSHAPAAKGARGGPRGRRGQVTVIHERSGETSTFSYVARHDDAAHIRLVIDSQNMTLPDLPPEAAWPIAEAMLTTMLRPPVTLTTCRRALALADHLETTPASHLPARLPAAWQDIFGRLLVAVLTGLGPADTTDATLTTIAHLLDRAALPAPTELGRRVEELIWERTTFLLAGHRPIPQPLRDISQKLGLLGGDDEKSVLVST